MSEKYTSVSMGNRKKLPTLKINNEHCSAEIALFGAHLLSFIPNCDAKERLWLSDTAVLDTSKPIRGGIPICWPWFADIYSDKNIRANIKSPAHGFVRTQNWQVVKVVESTEATTVILSPTQLGLYGFSEKLLTSVEFTFSQKCSVKLVTKNTSEQAIKITAALHSYFNVTDIHQTKIIGVAGKYIDKTKASAAFEQLLPYCISSETDRIHLQDENNLFNFIHLVCPDKKINIEQRGHDSVVVWNPWQKKSKTMTDMPDNSYNNMLCIEASITQGTVLAGHQQHELVQIIS
jgi:glucose-6-phosphate 1-epimerase